MQKHILSIDYAKFFFSICIIALHSQALLFLSGTLDNYMAKMLYSLAVPFFFFVSGFLLYNSLTFSENDILVIKARINRLFKPYILFSIINIVLFILISFFIYNDSMIHVILKIIQSIIFYPLGSLWFIWAMIVALVLLTPFIIRNKLKHAFYVGLFLYIAFLSFANSYYGLIDGTVFQKVIDVYLRFCVSARNGLFEGFFFIAYGLVFADNYNQLMKIPIISCILLLAIAIIANCFEVYFADKYVKFIDGGCIYFTYILEIPIILLFILKLDKYITRKYDSIIIRNLSTGIYLLQRPSLTVFSLFERIYTINSLLKFVTVLVIDICICLLVYKYGSKKVSSFLK